MRNNNQEKKHKTFSSISLSIASPEEILEWSHGEVKKPETINYRTQKPERDGLFCEKIFGPTKNWECYCGKYKRIRYKGIVCEKCGVEVTKSVVRRERMGHIDLAVPVTHIWYLRSTPSRIGLLLDLPVKTLEQVVYFAAHIVSEVDEARRDETIKQLDEQYQAEKKKIQEEAQQRRLEIEKIEDKKMKEDAEISADRDAVEELEELDYNHSETKKMLEKLKVGNVLSEIENRNMSFRFGHVFRSGTGAEAIREIIGNMDLKELIAELELERKKTSGQKLKKIIKRIKLAGNLVKSGIKPQWFIMTVLPVIPPDIRPMVQLDGGRFAASDLNDLYRRVINRNNRLKKLMAIGAPEVITRNEKRMLQEAVDTLLNNSARQGRTAFNAGDKRKLRSLSDMLKGKQGRFRQNLLGKRVDYSGRSVIIVGPKLKLDQCGLPKRMALELFKPFVIGRLIRDGYTHNIKNAEKLINQDRKEVWDILEEITKDHYVLLNRAPTLHRLGIQAFKPVLTEGKAIQIHPLVCSAFNADFDGDQMAVHLPLSSKAQKEAKEIICSKKNLLKPSAGEPIMVPTQDMVLGCYYLTKETEGKIGEGMILTGVKEGIIAHQTGNLHLQAKIQCRMEDGKIIETTLGRLIFNEFMPEGLPYYNHSIGKKQISKIIAESFVKLGTDTTAILVDNLKHIGFKFATQSGVSFAQDDMYIPAKKNKIIEDASEEVKKINDHFWKGLTTDEERYQQTIKVWGKTKKAVTEIMVEGIDEENNIHYMVNSGARGNWGQVTQLCGLKGLVASPSGRTIELPIKSNLKEGFKILEYFIATHGGRKGKSDTALKTAEAGYLTRRLVDANQDIIVRELDCGSTHAHSITRADSEKIGEEFTVRIYGRTLQEPIVSPKTGEIIAEKGEIIEHSTLRQIEEEEVNEVKVRSVMTCLTEGGICAECYGKDLGSNEKVKIGTAAGIIAAQSIGEPGTQLTMRTFHMGGVADGADITQGLTRVEEVFEARCPKNPAILAEIAGTVKITRKGKLAEVTITSDGKIETEVTIPTDMTPVFPVGTEITAKKIIAKATDYKGSIKSPEDGIIKSIEPGKIIIESHGKVEKTYKIPQGRQIVVSNKEKVKKGDRITNGHIDQRQLMALTDTYTVQKYIVTEVQTIYASQGQSINDKHLEIIAKQMLSKVKITEKGDGNVLPGETIDIIKLKRLNDELKAAGKKEIKGERLLLGLTRVSLQTESWLSAASFQETIRTLVEASTTKKVDVLKGLKENVIIGKLIPAGEVYRKNHGIEETPSHEMCTPCETCETQECDIQNQKTEENTKKFIPVI